MYFAAYPAEEPRAVGFVAGFSRFELLFYRNQAVVVHGRELGSDGGNSDFILLFLLFMSAILCEYREHRDSGGGENGQEIFQHIIKAFQIIFYWYLWRSRARHSIWSRCAES